MKLADLPPYREIQPRSGSSAVVFSSPHSGRQYPDEFLRQTRLDALQIRSSEDAYVDILFDAAPEFGAPLLCATAPRSFVDLNRSPCELDAELFDGFVPIASTARSRAGYGVIPRRAGDGIRIYSGRLPVAVAEARLGRFFRPFHRRLDELITERVRRFGEAILLDCHSMPHKVACEGPRTGSALPEVILGDRFGQAAAPDLVEFAEIGICLGRFGRRPQFPVSGCLYFSKVRPAGGRPARDPDRDRPGALHGRKNTASQPELFIVSETAAKGDRRSRRTEDRPLPVCRRVRAISAPGP